MMLSALKKVLVPRKPQSLWNIQLHAVRLQVFIECGLINELVSILKRVDEALNKLAFEILSPILQFSTKYLPESIISHVQALPTLFKYASDFKDEFSRHTMQLYLESVFESTKREKKGEVSSTGSTLQIDCSKQRVFGATEETQLHDLIQLSEVLNASKDHKNWNWDAIDELIDCLGASKKFDDYWRGSKFITRLLHFLKPSSRQFSEVQIEGSTLILDSILKFFQVLIDSSVGFRILTESKLVPEIVERIGRASNFVLYINRSPL